MGRDTSPSRLDYYCAGGRIHGAVKLATIGLIPKEAENPVNRLIRIK